MRPLERLLLGVLMAAAAFGEGVGSPSKPVVEPVGDVRELSRFSFRVTTPAVSAIQDPDGWTDLRITGFGARERRPGAPVLPSHTFLVALPEGGVPRLTVEPLSTRLLPGQRPRPVPRVRVTSADEPEDLEERRERRRVERTTEYAAEEALYEAPPPSVRLGNVGHLRDQRYVEVIVTPARYVAERGGVEVWDRFEVTVHFEGAEVTAPALSTDPRYEDVYRNAFVNYAQGLLFRRSVESTVAALGEAAALGTPRYEIKVRQAGVVRLDTTRLTGTGFLTEPIATWRLRSRGVEVPLHVKDTDTDGFLDPGEWVQFWGQALDQEPKTVLDTDVPMDDIDIWAYNDVTDENVYLLTAEPGTHARMATRASAPTFTRVPPADFEAVAHREVDDAFRPLGSEDPWSWAPTLQTGTATTQRTDDVPLPGLAGASSPIAVAVRMKAASEDGTLVPDHRTRVSLLNSSNTVLLQQDDDGTFDGRVAYLESFAWAGGSVTNPMRVRSEARPIANGNHSVMLDWIEVTYRRSFTAASDGLVFTWPNADAEFVVSGLTSPAASLSAYEVTAAPDTIAVPVVLTGVSVTGAGPFSARFRVDKDLARPDGSPRTFVVAGNGAATVPLAADFTADTVSDLRDPSNQADLVVIAHPAVLDAAAGSPLAQLLALRASRGLTSKVARLDDVEDEFNDGLPGPAAIKNFLRWVLSTAPGEGWASPKPAYVVLLGDGSSNPKAGTASGNFVPTQILFKDDPSLGYYASDNVMAAVVGTDALPDLAIGRLPARSVTEANVMLQKVLDYEQIPPAGSWRAHALFVSDRGKNFSENEALEFEATNAASQSRMKIPPHTAKQLRYWTDYGGNGPSELNLDIKRGINGTLTAGVDGAAVFQYIGHGNFDLWSDDILFDKSDVASLTNGGRLPWLLAHNCLTSGFHSTAATTLGEAFLKEDGGGAIAVFSPSGLSFGYFGELVAMDVFDALYGRRKEREIATAVTDALVTLCGQGSVEPCENYVLLGDPATQLALPTVRPAGTPTAVPGNARVDLTWAASASPGATYDVWRTGDLGPSGSYAKVNGAPIAGTAFADTSVTNAQTYYYAVVARDAAGFEGRWSNFNSDCAVDGPDCVDARPLNPNPPAAPAGLTVTDAESGGRLNIAWTPNGETDLRDYTVCWSVQSGGPYTCTTATKATTTWVLNGLANGIPHYVVIRATNTSNLTASSAEVSAVPTFVRGVKAPQLIDSLRVNRSGSDLLLTWDPVTTDIYGKPESAVTYRVYRGTTPDFEPSTANRIATNLALATFTDPGAVAGPAYHYLVHAVDVEGNIGGLGRQLPNGIDTLTLAKSLVTPGNVILSWPAVTTDFDGRPSRIREYRIYARATPFTRADIRNGTVGAPLTTTTGTQVELTPPAGGQHYSVLVVDERGNLSSF